MRREHISSESYIDWLKSLGCVLYLPLLEQGDLTDHITGNALHLTGNGSVSWNSSISRYLFTSPASSNQSTAVLNTNWAFPTNEITFMSRNKRYNTNNKSIWTGIDSDITTAYGSNLLAPNWCSGERSTGGITIHYAYWKTSNEFYFAASNSNNGRKFYQDGVLAYSDSYIANWQQAGVVTKLYLCATNTNAASNNRSAQIYFSDVMVFNKELTQQQIKEIQGIA